MRAGTVVAVCVVLASGCEDFARLKQLKPRKVTVRATDLSHLPDGGRVAVPRKAAGAAPCEVAVDGLLQAGWQTAYGTWVEDGVCEVRDVQPGETLLRVPELKSYSARKLYVVTKLDDVDLGIDIAGRPHIGAEDGTTVTLDVTGGLPFTNTSDLSLYVPAFARANNNTGLSVPDSYKGQTSFPATYDWKGFPLLQPGEVIDLFQYQTTQSAAGDQLLLVLDKHGSAMVQPIDTRGVRGGATMGPLSTGSPRPLTAFDVDPSALSALMKLSVPDSTFIGALASEQVMVGSVSDPLVVQQRFALLDGASLSLPAVSIDPLPGLPWRWQLSVQSFAERRIMAGVPGTATFAIIIQGPIDNRAWLSSTAIGPPGRIRERRASGLEPLEGTLESMTPVVAWDEPRVGKPNTYVFEPRRVDVSAGTARLVALDSRIVVSAPEAHVPPGLLSERTSYVFVVTADNCTATDPLRPRTTVLQPTCGLNSVTSNVFVTP